MINPKKNFIYANSSENLMRKTLPVNFLTCENTMKDNLSCPICFEILYYPVITDCYSNTFCQKCIKSIKIRVRIVKILYLSKKFVG